MGMPRRLRLACVAAALLGASSAIAAEAPLLIGQTADFSGPQASPVKETTLAAKAYFDQVNHAGGVKERKKKLLSVDDGVTVTGDHAALQVLMENLVDNAIRYTPSGGVSVRVRRDGGAALLEVEDTGPGIPREERTRVFDRFYRGEAAPTGGTGLGLAIVKRIAERHNARVELLDAGAGQGLRVVVRFPA